MNQIFFRALEEDNIELMQTVAKSDLHNHAGRGGLLSDLSSHVKPPNQGFNTLNDMQTWFEDHVKANVPPGLEGYLFRVEAAFKQAKRDGIKRLALSFGTGEVDALGGMDNFSRTMDEFKKNYIEDAVFIPELSLLRGILSKDYSDQVKSVIDYGWFQSIDICGNENAGPIDQYVDLYRYAKEKGLSLKLHVGEFGSAEDILEAAKLLDLDEIHHGIAAAESKECMAYLKEKDLVLNVCPMSNIMLKRVSDYKSHPIKKLYRAGIKVTINTDDLAIFNASVSREYLNLYKHGVLSKEELNHIRQIGLGMQDNTQGAR